MKSHIVAAAATIGLGFAAVSAEAATLGLTTSTPIIEASFAEVEYFEDFGFGDLSSFALRTRHSSPLAASRSLMTTA